MNWKKYYVWFYFNSKEFSYIHPQKTPVAYKKIKIIIFFFFTWKFLVKGDDLHIVHCKSWNQKFLRLRHSCCTEQTGNSLDHIFLFSFSWSSELCDVSFPTFTPCHWHGPASPCCRHQCQEFPPCMLNACGFLGAGITSTFFLYKLFFSSLCTHSGFITDCTPRRWLLCLSYPCFDTILCYHHHI